MIRKALRHLPGLGPERLQQLNRAGIHTWEDFRRLPPGELLPVDLQQKILAEIACSERAVAANDVQDLLHRFHPKDFWRIAGHFFDSATFFDIETTGLSADSGVTLISCLHRGRLQTFVRDENLDRFLSLLDDVKLLISFNGSSFDVPRILGEFHIPALPCPHVDLRWICYHHDLRGGLKSIERALGLHRPPDLTGTDGAEAIWLWQQWAQHRNQAARLKLERYCQADVLALRFITARLVQEESGQSSATTPDLWRELTTEQNGQPRTQESPPAPCAQATSSPEQSRLLARWQLIKRRRPS